MYANLDTLEKIAELAMNDDYLLSLLVEWNETQDWGMQDLVMCKIMNYVEPKLNASN